MPSSTACKPEPKLSAPARSIQTPQPCHPSEGNFSTISPRYNGTMAAKWDNWATNRGPRRILRDLLTEKGRRGKHRLRRNVTVEEIRLAIVVVAPVWAEIGARTAWPGMRIPSCESQNAWRAFFKQLTGLEIDEKEDCDLLARYARERQDFGRRRGG